MQNLKLIGVLALIVIPVMAVHPVAGNAAWCVVAPLALFSLWFVRRAWRDYEKTRQEALRQLEDARRGGDL